MSLVSISLSPPPPRLDQSFGEALPLHLRLRWVSASRHPQRWQPMPDPPTIAPSMPALFPIRKLGYRQEIQGDGGRWIHPSKVALNHINGICS